MTRLVLISLTVLLLAGQAWAAPNIVAYHWSTLNGKPGRVEGPTTGTTFGASQGAGKLELCPSSSYTGPTGCVVQSVTTWAAFHVDFTMTYTDGAATFSSATGTAYLYLTENGGTRNAAGYPINLSTDGVFVCWMTHIHYSAGGDSDTEPVTSQVPLNWATYSSVCPHAAAFATWVTDNETYGSWPSDFTPDEVCPGSHRTIANPTANSIPDLGGVNMTRLTGWGPSDFGHGTNRQCAYYQLNVTPSDTFLRWYSTYGDILGTGGTIDQNFGTLQVFLLGHVAATTPTYQATSSTTTPFSVVSETVSTQAGALVIDNYELHGPPLTPGTGQTNAGTTTGNLYDNFSTSSSGTGGTDYSAGGIYYTNSGVMASSTKVAIGSSTTVQQTQGAEIGDYLAVAFFPFGSSSTGFHGRFWRHYR